MQSVTGAIIRSEKLKSENEGVIAVFKVHESHSHFNKEVPFPDIIESFKREFSHAKIDRVTFLSLPHHAVDTVLNFDPTQNVKGLYLKKAFAPNAYAYAGLEHPMTEVSDSELSEILLSQAKEYRKVGYDGMKMLEGYPSMRKAMKRRLDSPVYDDYYSYLEEEEIPVTMHLANPEIYWDADKVSESVKRLGRFCDETYPTKEELHEEVDSLLEKHPRLKLTLAHFGFLRYDAARRYFENNPCTMLDMTPGGEMYFIMLEDWERWQTLFKDFSDRFKYGTDFYGVPIDRDGNWINLIMQRTDLVHNFLETDTEHIYYKDTYHGVKMDESIISKIYWENAERELGKPREIDTEYLRHRANSILVNLNTDVPYTESDLRYIIEN